MCGKKYIVVVVVAVGQTVGSISSETPPYDCLCTARTFTASAVYCKYTVL